VRLFEEKWLLIDCNLPHGEQRQRFFAFVSSHNIQKLAVLCLTHPHEDHFTGMHAVMEYFTSDGRGIDIFCDGGINPRLINVLLKRRNRPSAYVREYERIYTRLDELLKAEQIRYCKVDSNTKALLTQKNGEEIKLMPVGPPPQIALQQATGQLLRESFRSDLNRLSVVLALAFLSSSRRFFGLLAADTDAEGFRSALEELKERASIQRDKILDFIKIPHHGSADSHRNSIAPQCRKRIGKCVAAISAGNSSVLPAREVMRDYLRNKWTVLLTTRRSRNRGDSLLTLFERNPQRFSFQDSDLYIKWSTTKGLSWKPLNAVLKKADLDLYQNGILS
jgi:beta-lactamase superfamily II metal-dependent hydrolase